MSNCAKGTACFFEGHAAQALLHGGFSAQGAGLLLDDLELALLHLREDLLDNDLVLLQLFVNA